MKYLTLVAAIGMTAVPARVTAQTDWWPAPLLPHHSYAAAAFDVLRDRLVLFGGATGRGRIDATWEWNPAANTWRHAGAALAPSARERAVAAFDPVRGVVVLFGGTTDAGLVGDTWEWDGSTWTQRFPVMSPSARSHAAAVWDGGRARVLMFGGRTTSQLELAETWEFDGATWTQRSPVHTPGGRNGAAMAWDALRDRVVMFGGSCFQLGPCWRMDTWEWDGVDWTDVSPGWPNQPEPRWSHGMVYDDHRGVIVLYGGSDEPGHYKSDLWEWNGSAWAARITQNAADARLGHAMVWDPVGQRAIVVGGETWTGLSSDTYAYDGVDWQRAHPGQYPHLYPVPQADMVWDGDHGTVVWFGLGIGEGGAATEQTWVGNGDAWTLVDEGQGPQWPSDHRLAWLPSRHRVIAHLPEYLSRSEQTWEYDGTTWNRLTPAGMPGVRAGFAFALDPRFDRLVLFGGSDANGLRDATWLFDGNGWNQVAPTHVPAARTNHAMALDAARGRVVMFGGRAGSVPLGDTWEWDGSDWQQRLPAHAPTARGEHCMTGDCGRRRIVLRGGRDGSGNRTDTWEWDGQDWSERATANAPPASYWSLLAYDPTSHRTLHMIAQGDGTWLYGSDDPAEFTSFGGGCGGSLGPPAQLPEFGQMPHAGGVLDLALLRLPGPYALVTFGLSDATWAGGPLPQSLSPFGFPACVLFVSPDFASLLAVPGGYGRWQIAIPPTAGMVGVTFFSQAFALDPNGPDGLAATPAARGVVGAL